MLNRILNLLRKTGAVTLRSLLILAGLLLMIASGELWLRPLSLEGSRAFALLAAFCGAGFLLIQWLLFSLLDKLRVQRQYTCRLRHDLRGYQSQVKALEHRRRCLARRVEDLTAQTNLDNAAISSDSFDDFLNTIARLARDNSGARELTVFACEHEASVPLAAYQLTEATELCLTFDSGGASAIAADIAAHGSAVPNRFSASSMNIHEHGRQIVINGVLLYAGAAAGQMRLTVLNANPQNMPDRNVLRKLVASWLAGTFIDDSGIKSALKSEGPVAAPGRKNLIRLAVSLKCGEDTLGAIRIGFAPSENDNLYDQQKALSTTADRVARVLRHERIYEQAIKDGLTGLFNKRHMMTVFERQFLQSQRLGNRLCMILIDIDHFKKVNDTWGHLTGDIILREVSALLVENARASDLPCRYGGEELAVILPEEELATAAKMAERLRLAIERKEFLSDSGKALHVTASFGVACYVPGMTRVEDMIAAADQSLYVAKHDGRNRVVVARKEVAPVSVRA